MLSKFKKNNGIGNWTKAQEDVQEFSTKRKIQKIELKCKSERKRKTYVSSLKRDTGQETRGPFCCGLSWEIVEFEQSWAMFVGFNVWACLFETLKA